VIVSQAEGAVNIMTDEEKRNLDLVKGGYDAFIRGDRAACLALFAEDAELRVADSSLRDTGGNFRGPQGVAKHFDDIDAEEEIEEFRPEQYVAQGDKVVVRGYHRGKSKKTGQVYETHWVEVNTLRNGKIVKCEEEFDTAAQGVAYGRFSVHTGRSR
jgi:uncharacterized protein